MTQGQEQARQGMIGPTGYMGQIPRKTRGAEPPDRTGLYRTHGTTVGTEQAEAGPGTKRTKGKMPDIKGDQGAGETETD